MSEKITLLLIEDDQNIASFLNAALKGTDYVLAHATSGGEGLNLASTSQPGVILLDLGLPDMNGFEVLRRLRTWSNLPVIVVSARRSEQDKVTALNLGADDYVSKPFGTDELLARIRTSMRHNHSVMPESVYRAKDLEIHFGKHMILLRGEEVHLTQIEYQLLELLAEHSGKVLTYNYIMKAIWDPIRIMTIRFCGSTWQISAGKLNSTLPSRNTFSQKSVSATVYWNPTRCKLSPNLV